MTSSNEPSRSLPELEGWFGRLDHPKPSVELVDRIRQNVRAEILQAPPIGDSESQSAGISDALRNRLKSRVRQELAEHRIDRDRRGSFRIVRLYPWLLAAAACLVLMWEASLRTPKSTIVAVNESSESFPTLAALSPELTDIEAELDLLEARSLLRDSLRYGTDQEFERLPDEIKQLSPLYFENFSEESVIQGV